MHLCRDENHKLKKGHHVPTGLETSVMGLAMPVPNSDTTDIVAIIKNFAVLW